MAEEFLNITQLAGRVGVRERVIQRYVDAGTIPYLKIGKFIRFQWSDVEAWLNTLRRGNPLTSHPAIFTDTSSGTKDIPEGSKSTSEPPLKLTRGPRTHISAASMPEQRR